MYNVIIFKTTKQHFRHSDISKFRRDYLRTPLSRF